jgi:hypothetical protein
VGQSPPTKYSRCDELKEEEIAGHIACMGEIGKAYKILIGARKGPRSFENYDRIEG